MGEFTLDGDVMAGLDCRDAASARMTRTGVREAYRMATQWLDG